MVRLGFVFPLAVACARLATARLLLDPQFEALFSERPALQPSWARAEDRAKGSSSNSTEGKAPRDFHFLDNVTSSMSAPPRMRPRLPD
jgi:hypothetical protein